MKYVKNIYAVSIVIEITSNKQNKFMILIQTNLFTVYNVNIKTISIQRYAAIVIILYILFYVVIASTALFRGNYVNVILKNNLHRSIIMMEYALYVKMNLIS